MEKKYFSEILLLTKCRNKKDFIDWIEYHLNIGFDNIVVIDNESEVEIKSVCEQYGLEYHYIEGFPDQYARYNEYVNSSKSLWVLPIDDDEYLYMRDFTNVNDMLKHFQEKFPDMNKLAIRWKNMFPKNPYLKRGDMSLMDFCTESDEDMAKLFKAGNEPVKNIRQNHTTDILQP